MGVAGVPRTMFHSMTIIRSSRYLKDGLTGDRIFMRVARPPVLDRDTGKQRLEFPPHVFWGPKSAGALVEPDEPLDPELGGHHRQAQPDTPRTALMRILSR
jgi:hypothetical protein